MFQSLFQISDRSLKSVALAFSAGLVCAACAQTAPKTEEPAPAPAAAAPAPTPAVAQQPAVATFEPTGKSKIRGTVQFLPEGEQFRIVADISGLAPNSLHGFHIHEVGDCSDEGFKKAGGHYNPTSEEHGSMETQVHHAGDLNNLKADKKGHATYSATIANPKAPVSSLVGRAVIIHKKQDDLKTQPSGDSGDRIACALIAPQTK